VRINAPTSITGKNGGIHEEMLMEEMHFTDTRAREIISFLNKHSGSTAPDACILEGYTDLLTSCDQMRGSRHNPCMMT